jgi:hypothetical protein
MTIVEFETKLKTPVGLFASSSPRRLMCFTRRHRRRPRGICLLVAIGTLLMPQLLRADDPVENNTLNGKIDIANASLLTPKITSTVPLPDLKTMEPYKSGLLNVSDAEDLITRLRKSDGDTTSVSDTEVTIIHVLRWGSADHSTVMFQKWYVYDPSGQHKTFYLSSAQTRFQGTVIAGRKSFRFIYIHLNFDLNNNSSESTTTDPNSGLIALVHPVTYKVAITKQQTQFWKDVSSLLSLIGVVQAATVPASASDPVVGYFSVSNFTSQYKTSSIAVAVSHSDTPKGGTTAAAIGSQTFTNEGPSWVGLSVAVPLTSYKTLTYSQTNDVITTNTVNQQNIYAVFDLYLPPVEPAWTSLRYIPHPIFGMPIKKQPLRNTTAGLSMGWKYLQPFGSVVFNVQQRKSSATTVANHLVYKGAWGINISISDAVKSIKSSSASKTASATATKAAAPSP